MNKYQSSLKGMDLIFLYDILYQYEKEEYHKGYNYNLLDKNIKDTIKIYNKTRKKKFTFTMPKTDNTIVINSRGISVPLLTHLRHALAHACIEKRENKYIFNEQCNSKCKICGRVNVFVFKKFIREIIATR